MLGKHWETSLAGYLTIIGSVCTAGLALLHGNVTAATTALTVGIPAGVGLIRSADANKTPAPPTTPGPVSTVVAATK
jgi:hypothetical protein